MSQIRFLTNLLGISSLIAANCLIPLESNATLFSQNKITKNLEQHQTTKPTASDLILLAQENNQSTLEQQIIELINQVRTNPSNYAERLEAMKQYYNDNLLEVPGQPSIQTQEGIEALKEAISFLRSLSPRQPINFSRSLSTVANNNINTQEEGKIGIENNQLIATISPYGSIDESVDAPSSQDIAQSIVMQLIINDGFPNRIYRENLFNNDFKMMGISCQSQTNYEDTCIVIYQARETKTTLVEPKPNANNTAIDIPPPPNNGEDSNPDTSNSSPTTKAPLLLEQGILEEGDSLIPGDNTLYDSFVLEGSAGQSITITLESEDFDTFLAIVDPEGNTISQNDDMNGETTNSMIELTLPKDGVYQVIVNSYDTEGKGNYTLTAN